MSDVRQRWTYKKKVLEQFRRAWLQEYLTQLQTRHKWFTDKPNIQEGDLVLVEKDLLKRFEWPLARVQKLIYGRDGVVRSAQIVTKEQASRKRKGSPSYIVRSVRDLFPLEETPFLRSIPTQEEEQGGGPKLGGKS